MMLFQFKMIPLAISLVVITGCAGTDCSTCDVDDTLQMRAARRKAYKEERRELKAAQLEELDDEIDARRERRIYEREERRKQLDEQLHTKLALDLDQRLSVGTLQVNTDQLKKLIDERDAEHKKRLKIHEDAVKKQREDERRQLLADAQDWARLKQQAPSGQGDCCCVPPPDCARPFRPIRAPIKRPLKQPILPTEIPLMLPVTLQVALDNPRIGQTRVECSPKVDPCVMRV